MTAKLEIKWQTEAGLMACILIMPAGHRCGYVQVPQHLIGCDYNDICIDCHGGLTYAGEHETIDELTGYWVGFDCHHSMDAVDPALMDEEYRKMHYKLPENLRNIGNGVVRTKEYCIGECEYIAKQLLDISIDIDTPNDEPFTPEEGLLHMKDIALNADADREQAHCDADNLLCDILEDLGYGDMVAEFKSMDKWYA